MLTEFGVDPRWMAAFEPCMNDYDCGDRALYEWPNNVLSVKTVVYENGVISKQGEPVDHAVEPDELALCKRLSDAMHAFVADVLVGMKSEADVHWVPYFCATSAGSSELDEASVRALFGGTIMPLDRVVVEPMEEAGSFWDDLCSGEDEATLAAWRKLMSFVEAEPELQSGWFVQIGFYEYGETLDFEGEPPAGYEMKGSCLPRMALALTKAGSVVGVFGHVVWT